MPVLSSLSGHEVNDIAQAAVGPRRCPPQRPQVRILSAAQFFRHCGTKLGLQEQVARAAVLHAPLLDGDLDLPDPAHGIVLLDDVELCEISVDRHVERAHIETGLAGLRRALTAGGPAGRTNRTSVPARTGAATEGVQIAITRYGGPEVLVPRRASIRAPGSGEVRLLQTAVGVNFIDVYCRRGTFDLVSPGSVLGMEAAGVVESVGLGVGNVHAGDRVAYACAPPGAYASMRTMRADLLVRLPKTIRTRPVRRCCSKESAPGFCSMTSPM
jgi:Alcohol dehydrogenase GroES-like domain